MCPKKYSYRPRIFEIDQGCIDFDGNVEFLRTTGSNNLGIGNSWSIMMSVKADRDGNETEFIFETVKAGSGGGDNAVRISKTLVTPANDTPLEIENRDDNGAVIKRYQYLGFLPIGTWVHLVVTWNGTDIKVYKNGSFVNPSTQIFNNSGTMVNNADKQIIIASNFTFTQDFEGRIHAIAIWDTTLSASSITAIYNSGLPGEFDLKTDSGNYTNSDDLFHWWKLGAEVINDNTIAKDEVPGGFNLIVNSLNITTDDVFTDHPGI